LRVKDKNKIKNKKAWIGGIILGARKDFKNSSISLNIYIDITSLY
jgi:hypothetical protein